jgi:DNA-binding MarR family transcriptional regulator
MSENNLFDLLDSAIKDPKKTGKAVGLLRALGRPFLQAIDTRRVEKIEPWERRLHFLARVLRSDTDEDSIPRNTGYILGRLDALMDLCGSAIDRSLSEKVLQAARRSHVQRILKYLLEHGETKPGDLSKFLDIKQTHLSNILRSMEEADLASRREFGRYTLVSIGPQGEAAYRALETGNPTNEAPQTGIEEEQEDIHPQGLTAGQEIGHEIDSVLVAIPEDKRRNVEHLIRETFSGLLRGIGAPKPKTRFGTRANAVPLDDAMLDPRHKTPLSSDVEQLLEQLSKGSQNG